MGATLDDIPLHRLVTEARTFDLSAHPPGPVGVADLARHLGSVRRNDIVLFSSGNAANWGHRRLLARLVLSGRRGCGRLIDLGVSGVGFDGPSADPVDSVSYDLHQVWLGNGKIIIENLASMARLPARCRIVVAPLKVLGANGGPARVYAFLDE
jgi:kynurenine formamidase